MAEDLVAEEDVPSRLSRVVLTHYAKARERAEQWTVPHVDERHSDMTYHWAKDVLASNVSYKRMATWTLECATAGAALMHHCVTVDPEVRGGRLVLRGTGFTVAQTLAELAASSGVDEVAEDFDLDKEVVRTFLNGLSLLFERTWVK